MFFADVESAVVDNPLLPPYLKTMLLVLVIVFGVGMVLYAFGWRVIDWITPGRLNDEIVPRLGTKPPNVALAIIVGSMLLGLAIVLGATIHGVLTH